MKVKNSAIIYTGYDYQTLQGVKLLTKWLTSPTQYSRIAFEADSDSNETPEGIDDVVCERPDGTKDFWQVKFTPSPDKSENMLIWSWLLEIKGKTDKSRSIVKKFYDAISNVPSGKLGQVTLLTNKRPDRIMESCIRGSKIDFQLIDKTNQQEIIRQLGNEKAAQFLFSTLTIQHSDGDYQTLNRDVRAELLKLSDELGIERLIAKSREWAMFQNNPPESGWIYLHHVREILSLRRPDPIPEIFSVPYDYCLPDSIFHDKLLQKITSSKGEVITLTGKPGAGKSTYLSFLCQSLENLKIPLARHHYFLSLNDTTEDRLSPRIVAESLLHQIDNFHKDANADTTKPENLRKALITCASYYKDKGVPFVVLIDGLDHVWRDNTRNKKPLDEIFRQLLPVTDNLIVLVGTQPVDDNLLPNVFLTYSPRDEWNWLPEMSGNAIYEFLKANVESDRLHLNHQAANTNEELQHSAKALLELTKGYPLHIIYSSEFLSHHGLPLSSWQIEKLPPCSDGNIATYYFDLWRSLTYKQQDVLHLCSGFQFAWTRHAIATVIKDDHEQSPSVDAVAHMLSEGLSGVRPFHESLIVFVRNQEDHQSRINALLPPVCDWLNSKAPTHLRDKWLWSCLAKAGDNSKLRQGITRDWVLDKLISGHSTQTFIRLLSEAETYAFNELQYSEAYQHRELKTRLINGPEFQIENLTDLKILSLVGASEDSLNEVISEQNEYSPVKLSTLATVLWYVGKQDQAKTLSKKAIDRYRNKTKLMSRRNSQDDENEASILIKAGTLTDTLNYDGIFENEQFSKWPNAYIGSFRAACCIKWDIDLLLRAWNCLLPNSNQAQPIELDVIRLSIIDDADLTHRPEYKLFNSQLARFKNIYSTRIAIDIDTYSCDEPSEFAYTVKTTTSYHDWFFSSLCFRLNANADYSWLPVTASVERVDVSDHYALINELVDSTANALLAGDIVNFDFIISIFPPHSILEKSQWEAQRAETLLKRAWIEIAADCHLVATQSEITFDDLKYAIDSDIFITEWFRLWYKEINIKLLSDDAATLLIQTEINRLEKQLEETIEKSNAYLELAQIAYRHKNLGTSNKCLRKTWDFVLGYGHHKDSAIFNVLKAVKYLAFKNQDCALTMLERISPIVFNISKFTDGDETRHSQHSISSLIANLNPQTTASIYEQELRDGEWYYSEETILKLLERADFSSPITKHLYLTGLPSSCNQLLKEKVLQNNFHAIQIESAVKNSIGIELSKTDSQDEKANEFDEKITLQPSSYPPDKFKDLVDALKDKYSNREFWKSWYSYWVEQYQEPALLKNLMPHIADFSDSRDDKKYLLDCLFLTYKKLNGKTKAFDLLVEAHNAMNGWSEWYESDENTINRLKIVAEIYPKRIDEFIKRTTIQKNSWNHKFGSIIIPNDKLVFLLAYGGRQKEAYQLTLAMTHSLENNVRNLQLTKPDWDWRQDDTIEEALTKALVSRLKTPIPSVKLWAMEQLATLLVEQHPTIEDLLKKDLANRKLESECIEVLCVFLNAKFKGYSCPEDLGQYINARSTLSDLVLSELISTTDNFGNYAYSSNPGGYLDNDNNQFDYFQGNHVPLLYNSWLMKQEQKTGLPFTSHYKSEWNKTFEYQPPVSTSVDYFFGINRQRSTGQFYTQASHRGRSAYLRTIEVAKEIYNMPHSYAEHLSIPALPVEPCYLGLSAQKPLWLPEWRSENLPNEKNIRQFIKSILKNFSITENSLDLIALSFPIKIENDKWIDLTFVKAMPNLQKNISIEIIDRSSCICVGTLLNKSLSYEFDERKQLSGSVLAGTSMPFMRYGHWHSDMESRGFYIPTCNISGKNVTALPKDGLLFYTVDEIEIGFSSYWYNQWSPIHPKGVRSVCGTYTVSLKENINTWFNFGSKKTSGFYICDAKVLTSKDQFREYDEQEYRFTLMI